MAVVPALATMAALTLFRNPGYGEDSVEDYWHPRGNPDVNAPATKIQKSIRSYLARARTLVGQVIIGFVTLPHRYRRRKSPFPVSLQLMSNAAERTPLWHKSRRINRARVQYYGPYSITE